MTSWSIMFYSINFFSRNQWGMSIERSIIYYEGQLLLYKNNRCQRRCRPESYSEKFEHFGYREIKSPRNCLEAEKRET